MDWLAKLLDVGLGGLPSALVSFIPEDTKRRARAHLEAHNPFSQISVNHDLLRATRLAWIEAAEKIIREAREQAKQPEWKRDAADINSVSGLGISEIAAARDIALDRLRDPGTSPIDRHIEAVIRGVPEFVSPGNDRLLEGGVSGAFVAVLAELCRWPQAEMPPIFQKLAHEGLPVRGGKSRAFGELMFAAFAELIKNPQRYPEAKAAFSMVQIHQVLDATEATKAVAVSVFAALGALDGKLEAAIGRRDAGGMLREGADAYLELLPEIAESVARIDETTRRTEEKVDVQTVMLQELLARSAPGLPLATAKAILAAFGEDILPETERDIERILRAKAEEFTVLSARLQEMANSGDVILRGLLHEAEILIEQGDFDGAEDKLISAEDRADLARAQIRANRGDLANLRMRYLDAAAHYQSAADIISQAAPSDREDYLQRSAESLFDQGEKFNDADSLRASVLLYQDKILPLYDDANRAKERAILQSLLGRALWKLGDMVSDEDILEQSIAINQTALLEIDRNRENLIWSEVQTVLANALQSLGTSRGDTSLLETSLEAYHEALESTSREQNPLGWSIIQNNIANSIYGIEIIDRNPILIFSIIDAYRAALEECTPNLDRFIWAGISFNLAQTLERLALREESPIHADESISIYRSIIDMNIYDHLSYHWLKTQERLGDALIMQGQRKDEVHYFKNALEAYLSALEAIPSDALIFDRAKLKRSSAEARLCLFDRTGDRSLLMEAQNECLEARQVYVHAQLEFELAATGSLLAEIRARLN